MAINGIKRNLEVKQRAIKVVKMFERRLLTRINKRLPHDELLSTFSMFEIEAIIKLKEDQILLSGNEHLFKLEKQLGMTKKNYIAK